LVELAAALIDGEDEAVLGRVAESGAERLLEKGELVTGAAGHVDAVELAQVAEAGGDVDALPVRRPAAEAGAAGVLVLVQAVDHGRRNFRNSVEDEHFVVQGILALGGMGTGYRSSSQ